MDVKLVLYTGERGQNRILHCFWIAKYTERIVIVVLLLGQNELVILQLVTIGIEKAHPELSNNPDYDESKGVSCVLVNTSKGHELFRLMQQKIHFMPSEFAKVAEKNGQLKVPSAIPVEREYIMDIYHKKGYNGVENYFRAEYRKQIVMHTVYNTIPRKMRLKLKKIVKG